MMLKILSRGIIFALCCTALLAGAGCGQNRRFARVDSGDTGVWSGGAASSVELKTPDYAKTLELGNTVSMYLSRVGENGLDAQTLAEMQALAADLKTYDFTGSALAEYIGVISSALDCVLGFYYFNSSDAMLTQRIQAVSAAHGRIDKLEQTTILPPDEQAWRAAAGKCKEFGESRNPT